MAETLQKKNKNRTVRLHYSFCTFNSIFICKKKKSNLNATQQHLQTLSCFIYSLASFNIFPLVIRVLSASSHPGGPAAPSQLETNCSSSSLCQELFLFFFFFYGRGWVTLVCSTARDWLLAAPLSPLLPWQCCTVIDKVDKEMLGHAPDRLDLKSPRWGERQQPDSIH